ncbi:hypothetical protein ARMGADRAFT_1068292, partial [Armillaria gallica]
MVLTKAELTSAHFGGNAAGSSVIKRTEMRSETGPKSPPSKAPISRARYHRLSNRHKSLAYATLPSHRVGGGSGRVERYSSQVSYSHHNHSGKRSATKRERRGQQDLCI